jgi:hypothetical protein
MVDPASRKKTHMKHHLLRKSSEDPPPFTVYFQGVDLLQVLSYPQQYVHKEQVSEQPKSKQISTLGLHKAGDNSIWQKFLNTGGGGAAT